MTQEEFHKRYQYNPNADCLGEGGFGKVYKAYDTHLDQYVAIKMAEVKPHLEEVRLRKEVEVISKLPTHPNIAHYDVCYTFSTFAGEYDFGVLQYYEQGNLQQLLSDNQLTYEQKDNLLKQILEGIVFLHSQGIIHRDLKPQNILIALNRKGEYIPKITDFGISKKLDINKSSVFTNSLAGAGTLAFASPEQLLGTTIRKNTDLWSFGVIACWMFTGILPFTTGNQTVTSEAGRIELFKQITSGEATAILAQIPADWRNMVRQCLVVDVEKRISGAGSCLEMVSGKAEVPIENHKSENTSKNTTVTSTATTEAPHTTTNYSSTRIESAEPKPTLTTVKVETPKSHLGRNIFIGLAVIAMVILSLFYLFDNSDESSQQTAVRGNIETSNVNEGNIGVKQIENATENVNDKLTGAESMIIGNKSFGSHWISPYGSVAIKKNGGKISISGNQISGEDLCSIEGEIEIIDDRNFKFNGDITLVYNYTDYETSQPKIEKKTLSGTQIFRRFGKRPYWRLKQPDTNSGYFESCYHYIDIFMN